MEREDESMYEDSSQKTRGGESVGQACCVCWFKEGEKVAMTSGNNS